MTFPVILMGKDDLRFSPIAAGTKNYKHGLLSVHGDWPLSDTAQNQLTRDKMTSSSVKNEWLGTPHQMGTDPRWYWLWVKVALLILLSGCVASSR